MSTSNEKQLVIIKFCIKTDKDWLSFPSEYAKSFRKF